MTISEQIRAAVAAAKPQQEPVKFLGIDAFVCEMSAAERDAFEVSQMNANKLGNGLANFRSKLVARCLVDEAGHRIYGDAEVGELANVPATALMPVYDAAVKINGMGAEAREAEQGK